MLLRCSQEGNFSRTFHMYFIPSIIDCSKTINCQLYNHDCRSVYLRILPQSTSMLFCSWLKKKTHDTCHVSSFTAISPRICSSFRLLRGPLRVLIIITVEYHTTTKYCPKGVVKGAHLHNPTSPFIISQCAVLLHFPVAVVVVVIVDCVFIDHL